MFYYIVEVYSNKANLIATDENLNRAKDIAREHSAKTGVMVEIQNEFGRVLGNEVMWREQVHIKLTQVRPGSKVIVRADIGTGGSVEATVVSVEAAIKNGTPGISYTNNAGELFWAYLDQIARVVKF